MSSSEVQIILESMDIISHLTGYCIKFIRRTSESDYISFQKGLQCMSNIGRMGGKQFVTYAPGCLKKHGDVQHELMHVMGFFHEHSRQDRDHHIKIIWDNIASGDREQFTQHAGNTYDLPYDYESILHYKYNAFAKDAEIPTIVPSRKRAKIGQNDNLSPLDIARIHRRFGCSPAAAVNFAGLTQFKLSDDKPTNCNEIDMPKLEATMEPLPQFSQEPMTLEECALQFYRKLLCSRIFAFKLHFYTRR
ncbi:zinc metalloproteinase nas-6-like [Paramacrobiotus metropolitanus]|uniref:zinc metalloproteinase nas-6-like n=1 Tax=Paramacrobiotus metropolitanus TaxID=2943436 RepID=UPI002445EEE4|nr:zinc metalloproteinase nas-6-like [Paramacrobiotus metropolitanus]